MSGSIVMDLNKALHVLADVHTRADDVTGFVVDCHPSYDVSRFTEWEYLAAWKTVREHIHLPTAPEQLP